MNRSRAEVAATEALSEPESKFMGIFSHFFGSSETAAENGALVMAMRRASSRPSPRADQAVHQALLASDLIIPTARTLEDATARSRPTSEQSLTVPMITIRNDDGQIAMLAFTDEEALRAWCSQGCAWKALHGPDVFAMALETRVDRVIINPAGPTGGTLDRCQIASLAEHRSERNPGHKAHVQTGPADQTPVLRLPQNEIDSRFLSHVREALGDRQEIAAGYFFEMTIGPGDPHLGVGVEFGCPMSPQAVHETMTSIYSEVQGHLPEGQNFDFLPLVRDEMLNLAREHGLQIYRQL